MKKGFIALVLAVILVFANFDFAYAANETSDLMYEKATEYPSGDTTKIENVLKKAASGQDITIAFLGGSITEGTAATKYSNSYVSLVHNWWCEKFPDINVTLINAGIGGTSSYLGLHRLDDDVLAYNPDLVFIEFAANDSDSAFSEDSYEQIIRKLLYGEQTPAVILLFTTTETGYDMQAVEQFLGCYYKLPMISYGNAVMAAINEGRIEWTDISADTVHPNDFGHYIFASIITRYLENIYKNLDTLSMDDTLNEDSTNEIEAMSSYTQHIYYNAHIENALTLKASSAKGYGIYNINKYFKYNWYLFRKDSYITFEVNAANIGIVYQRVDDGSFGQYDVYVDGKYITTLDGNYTAGNGTSTQEQSLYISPNGTVGKHTIKFVHNINSSNDQFIIAGLLIG